jgi:hypothetical protein
LSSYLSDRTKIVKISNTKSNPLQVSSGVIQLGHLYLFLFLIFINDIYTVFKHNQFLLFADDIKIYFTVNHINDCLKLHQDLDHFSKWCLDNGLHLNVNKCMKISFHRKRSNIIYHYNLSGSKINVVNEVRVIGITLSSDLSFKRHKEIICAKAFRILGFIKRNCSDMSFSCLKIVNNFLIC